jgi:hypothetical protein
MSASLADKELNSYVDNGDGTFSQRTAAGSGGTQTVQSVAQVSTNQWPTRPAAGTQNAPGAGSTIVASSAVVDGAGYYDVQLQWGYGATAEATTVNNFIYTITGVNQGSLVAAVASPNTVYGSGIHFKAKLVNGDVLRIGNSVNASAGSVYIGAIYLTREA